ncbi:MAG: prolyl aminopeptidase, partial [Candidatus Saccharibacteria bacterium]|nr:prolyl aminopeptidase [Pseudorhodobacter sp.]
PQGPQPNSPYLEAHYFQNHSFMPPDHLMNQAHRLSGIPGIIVQARYDLLCPPATSFALTERWPGARIVMAELSGHNLGHPAVWEAVKQAIATLTAARA